MAADWFDYRTTRGRTLVCLSDLCLVGASVVLASAVGGHWSWGPFALGPIVGVLGLGVYAALLAIVFMVVRPDADQRGTARQRLREQNRIVIPNYVCFGLCAGLFAGSLDTYWPDLVLAAMILVLGLVVPLAVLPLVKRKADAMRGRERVDELTPPSSGAGGRGGCGRLRLPAARHGRALRSGEGSPLERVKC